MKTILEIILALLGLSTKAIAPDSVRERTSQIKVPKKKRKVENWIDGKDAERWAARVNTLNLPRKLDKKITRYVKELILWGADIEDIRKTEKSVEIDYCRDGISYPTELFQL